MFFIILFFSCIHLLQNKNIFLPFKKITVEYLNETKTISDFIKYHIYTNISMGTPKKEVAHFIIHSNYFFYYNSMQLQYLLTPEYNRMEEEVEKSLNIFYYTPNSSSFDIIDDYFSCYSDNYTFKDFKGNEKTVKLEFNMRSSDKTEKLVGNLDLKNPIQDDDEFSPYDDYDRYLFRELKNGDLIDKEYFTFLYGDYIYEDNSKYFDEDYDNILGNLIIGDPAHEFEPEKYKIDDEIKIFTNLSDQNIEIKFKAKISNYTEEKAKLSFVFDSEFIRGNDDFKYEIDNIFFNELVTKNICRIDYVGENIAKTVDILYSCENNNAMKEKLKYFPTVYIEATPSNLTFLFGYKDLFKLHHNRLYFLIYFKNNTLSDWTIGELFFRKYIVSFHYYPNETMTFYKQQVDDINQKTDIPYPDEKGSDEKEPEGESSFSTRTIIEIVMGVVIAIAVVIIVLFIIRWKKMRKKRASELKDDYEYIPEGQVN